MERILKPGRRREDAHLHQTETSSSSLLQPPIPLLHPSSSSFLNINSVLTLHFLSSTYLPLLLYSLPLPSCLSNPPLHPSPMHSFSFSSFSVYFISSLVSPPHMSTVSSTSLHTSPPSPTPFLSLCVFHQDIW